MVQAKPKSMTFQEFPDWKPETGRYELHDGVMIKRQPTGPHEQVIGLLNRKSLSIHLQSALGTLESQVGKKLL